jgi:hypothetical protein
MEQNKNLIVPIMFCCIFFISRSAISHGVTGAIHMDSAVIAEIRYDNGEPFSYSQVKIYAPGNDRIEYLNTRTDAGGVVAFLPDKKGIWRIVASDGLAHGKELEFDFKDEKLIQKTGSNWMEAHRQKMIKSFLLIWAVVSTSLYFGARSKLKKINN